MEGITFSSSLLLISASYGSDEAVVLIWSFELLYMYRISASAIKVVFYKDLLYSL